MPKKKIEFPEDAKEEKFEEYWDFRKILVGVLTLLLTVALTVVGDVVVMHLLSHQPITASSFVPKFSTSQDVKAASTGPTIEPVHISIPSAEDVQNQVQTLQQQVTHLNVAEVATSSPQVQQILKQIEGLPAAPESQVKDACVRLCNNL